MKLYTIELVMAGLTRHLLKYT